MIYIYIHLSRLFQYIGDYKKNIHSSDTVFHAAGMELQSSGRRLNVYIYESCLGERQIKREVYLGAGQHVL